MIYNILNIVREDSTVLIQWGKGESLPEIKKEDQQQRVQVAAARMLAVIGMVFGGIWALQIITFVVTFPIKVLLKLAFAIYFYAMAYDVFKMSQNYSSFKQEGGRFLDFLRAKQEIEEEIGLKYTHGTLLQPLWMWLYVNRHKLPGQIPKR